MHLLDAIFRIPPLKIKRLHSASHLIKQLSQLTFGVYLVHWAFIQLLRNSISEITTEATLFRTYLVTALVSIFCSFLLAWLLRRYRSTRALVGG